MKEEKEYDGDTGMASNRIAKYNFLYSGLCELCVFFK